MKFANLVVVGAVVLMMDALAFDFEVTGRFASSIIAVLLG